ncbi:hypothetical protein DY000_02041082 [Brassica cretica]|uniref:Uncharacterized protein n=1 Tax=Brassica cretica TaxID=69181 RepID=A0ABQ7BES4_BRACR|nr:hypothetical protein DY000_02041082 [Brassica cretica]
MSRNSNQRAKSLIDFGDETLSLDLRLRDDGGGGRASNIREGERLDDRREADARDKERYWWVARGLHAYGLGICSEERLQYCSATKGAGIQYRIEWN